MPIVSSLLAGGVLALSAHKLAREGEDARAPRRVGGWGLIRGMKNIGADLGGRVKEVVGKAQAFVGEQSAGFLRDYRTEHLRDLESDGRADDPSEPEGSAPEADVDRSLAIAGSGSVIAIVGALTHTPLVLLSIPFSLYACIPLVKVVHEGLVGDKKLRGPIIDLVAVGASLATHYYVLTSMSCTLMCVAEKLVYRVQDRSRREIESIFKQQNPHVWMIVGDETREVPLADVQVGDFLELVAGGAIPVDGVVVVGEASIDEHMLTGESRPVDKTVGDVVLASTLVLAGKIRIRVEKTGQDTITAQIGAVMGEIADYRERQELRCDDAADKLVWPTLGAGALTQLTLGLRSAMTVVACNFTETLRIAYPLGALSYLNIAAKQGILVKDARALEMFSKIDTVLFDKTGTLTLATPHVGKIHSTLGMDENTLLSHAASAEMHQTHPIARAIQEVARERHARLLAVQDVAYDVGHGIRVILAQPTGQVVRVGSARFMAREGIAVPEAFQALEMNCHSLGQSLVYVAVGDALAGAIELHATLRPDVQTLVQKLKQRGLALYVVSGDHPQPTEHLARMLGFDGFRAQVLPAEKAQFVKQLQSEGRKVCFVGDGINDAIALKQADISISLRGATTVATDISQVILIDQNLCHIERLLDLGDELDANQKRSYAAMVVPSAINLAGALFFKLGIGSSILLFNASLLAGVVNGLSPTLRDLARAGKSSESVMTTKDGKARSGAIPQYTAFKRLEITDRAEIEAHVRRFPPYSQFSFPSLLAYDFSADTQVSWLHGNLVVRLQDFTTMGHFYSFLGTNEIAETIETLLTRAEAEGIQPALQIVPEICLAGLIEQLRDKFDVEEDESCFDYILDAVNLARLSTPIAHPKAHEVQRFLRQHPDVLVDEVDLAREDVRQSIRDLFELWVREKNKSSEEVQIERRAIDCILSSHGQLDLLTFGAFFDGQLVAFTMNEMVPGGYYVGHFGKADPRHRGLGLYLEQETAKRMIDRGCVWMNYEEDLGAPGLRAYKRSLNPVAFLKKYSITRRAVVTKM